MHITKPCEKVQMAAIRKNMEAYEYIDKPTKRVKAFYKKMTGIDSGE